MAHECVECGQECYCDMEDHGQAAPDDCSHQCAPENEGLEWDDCGGTVTVGNRKYRCVKCLGHDGPCMR